LDGAAFNFRASDFNARARNVAGVKVRLGQQMFCARGLEKKLGGELDRSKPIAAN